MKKELSLLNQFAEEVLNGSPLEKKELIILAAEVALGQKAALKQKLNLLATDENVAPEEVRDTIFQTAPYLGVEKVRWAIDIYANIASDVTFKDVSVATPETIEAEGNKVFESLWPDLSQGFKTATDDVSNYLRKYCFGEWYSRTSISLKNRELITIAVLATIGDTKPQLSQHCKAAINVGNTKEDLAETFKLLIPFIGFPRYFNAINTLNEALK